MKRAPHFSSTTFTRVAVLSFVVGVVWAVTQPFTSLQAAGNELIITDFVSDQDGVGTVLSGERIVYTAKYRCAATTGQCQGAVITVDLDPLMELETVTGGEVDSYSFNALTGDITITMNSVIDDGNAGQIVITSRFKQGECPPGTVANVVATATGTNLNPTTSPINTLTSSASPQWTLDKSLQTNPAVIDRDVTYQIRFQDNGNDGNLNLTNVILTDTLPTSVTVISTDGGTYDPVRNIITWSISSLNAGSGTTNIDRTVTVRYETPDFSIGDNVSNNATASGTPLGGGSKENLSNTVFHPLEEFKANPVGDSGASSRDKSGGREVPVGYEVAFDVRLDHAGNVSVTDYTVFDNLPEFFNLEQVTMGQYEPADGIQPVITLSYQSLLSGTTWNLWHVGSYTTTNPVFNVSDLSGIVSTTNPITAVRWQISIVPPGFDQDTLAKRIQLTGTIRNPGFHGTTRLLGDVFANCITGTFVYTNTRNFGPECAQVTLINPRVNPEPTKSEPANKQYKPGDQVSYQVTFANGSKATDPLTNGVVYFTR